MDKVIPVASYIRISTYEQVEGFSLDCSGEENKGLCQIILAARIIDECLWWLCPV